MRLIHSRYVSLIVLTVLCLIGWGYADDFGIGENAFTIDFVTISGDTNPATRIPADDMHEWFTFTGVNNDYRMGVFEISNDQWFKFVASLGVPVTGSPEASYDDPPSSVEPNMPTNCVSWHEAAQFVNWLNTSSGYAPAYRFTGTHGTGDYTLGVWDTSEAEHGTNLFRHKEAFYYLPTEDEWIKAAYWNGVSLQQYASPDDTLPTEDVDSNYGMTSGGQVWAVDAGTEELNGTRNMMGNIWEYIESPFLANEYGTDSTQTRVLRGGMFWSDEDELTSMKRTSVSGSGESTLIGFRVASDVPEPATMSLLGLGAIAILRRRRVRA
jgi:formylglycine-generating enzyme required for sulfatase activity